MRFRDLWTLRGRVNRWTYVAIGFSMMALKYNLDRVIAYSLGRAWDPLHYWFPALGISLTSPDENALAFAALMLTVALPFIWIGVAMTLGRLRDAGLPPWLTPLFFIPFVNLFFFLVLCAVPSKEERAGLPSGAERWVRVLPQSRVGAAAAAAGIAMLLGVPYAVLSVTVLREYGVALFVGLPFAQGLGAATIYGLRHEAGALDSAATGLVSVAFSGLMIFVLAVEGFLCLFMAAPLGLSLGAFGGFVGWAIVHSAAGRRGAVPAALMLLLALPGVMGAEGAVNARPDVRSADTSVEIEAPPAAVWNSLVAFSRIAPPTELMFRAGIAYPTHARIEGAGVGAVRHCVFSTGEFVEPITVWDEPRRLEFNVSEQPVPMFEWSWKKGLDAPHLHDFFVSEHGRFLLEDLGDGRVRLTGTTWYRHAIRPQGYWSIWSDAIIHAIHRRVLNHIKADAERAA